MSTRTTRENNTTNQPTQRYKIVKYRDDHGNLHEVKELIENKPYDPTEQRVRVIYYDGKVNQDNKPITTNGFVSKAFQYSTFPLNAFGVHRTFHNFKFYEEWQFTNIIHMMFINKRLNPEIRRYILEKLCTSSSMLNPTRKVAILEALPGKKYQKTVIPKRTGKSKQITAFQLSRSVPPLDQLGIRGVATRVLSRKDSPEGYQSLKCYLIMDDIAKKNGKDVDHELERIIKVYSAGMLADIEFESKKQTGFEDTNVGRHLMHFYPLWLYFGMNNLLAAAIKASKGFEIKLTHLSSFKDAKVFLTAINGAVHLTYTPPDSQGINLQLAMDQPFSKDGWTDQEDKLFEHPSRVLNFKRRSKKNLDSVSTIDPSDELDRMNEFVSAFANGIEEDEEHEYESDQGEKFVGLPDE